MRLPKIEHPVYSTNLLSTGQRIEYRPFTSGEEKVLLTAAEDTNDVKQQMVALKNVADACTFNRLDIENLTQYDIENLFLKIRMQAVSPTVDMTYSCNQPDETTEDGVCGQTTDVTVPLDQVDLEYYDRAEDTHKTFDPSQHAPKNGVYKVELTDKIGVMIHQPKVSDTLDNGQVFSKFLTNNDNFTYDENGNKENLKPIVREQMREQLAYNLIDSIYDEESVMQKGTDFEFADYQEFVSQLSHSQKEKIDVVLDGFPHVHHRIHFKCSKCGHETNLDLRGMQDFLG